MKRPLKISDPTTKYTLKIDWSVRRALNRAIARKVLAINATGMLLQTMPPMNHVILEVLSNKLNLEMPILEVDAKPTPDERVNLMFQSPWRIKKIFGEMCSAQNVSQNSAINDILKSPLEEIEARVRIDDSIGWEPAQGFTCTIDSILKRKIFQRCAEKMLECDGARQWGAGDMINLALAAATEQPLSSLFFEAPDRLDNDKFDLIIHMPLAMHQALQSKSEQTRITMSKLIRAWLTEFIDRHKV